MKRRLNPTTILLNELPPEGREYLYDSEAGELNSALADLIGSNTYQVRLAIRPIGNAFELSGEIKTHLNLQCSLCAYDFTYPIDERFREVLVIQEPLHKGDQNSRANHSTEWDPSQPEAIYMESDVFRVEEFIHELVGIAEPIRPLGKSTCEQGVCENLTEIPKRDWLTMDSKDAKPIRNQPFAVLEKMKLKS